MDAQDWSSAITYFDRTLEKNPSNSIALNAKGVALFQMGEFEQAIPIFSQSIQADSINYKP